MSRRTNAPGSGKLQGASKSVQRGGGTLKQYKKSASCTSIKCIFNNHTPHVHGPGVIDRLKTMLRKIDLARQSHYLKQHIPRYCRRNTVAVLFGVQNGRRP